MGHKDFLSYYHFMNQQVLKTGFMVLKYLNASSLLPSPEKETLISLLAPVSLYFPICSIRDAGLFFNVMSTVEWYTDGSEALVWT